MKTATITIEVEVPGWAPFKGPFSYDEESTFIEVGE